MEIGWKILLVLYLLVPLAETFVDFFYLVN